MEEIKRGNKLVQVIDPKTKYVSEYSMDIRLKNNLDKKVIPSLNKKDKDYVLIVDGGEGCLFEDTLIKTSKGDIKIKDLNNNKPFFVESLDIDKGKQVTNKAICVKSGVKELFEIETEDGRKIKATANHTFFVLRNKKVYEVELANLKEGDELICK